MVKGLKNAYLMHFSSLHSWFHCRGCYYLKCSSSLSQSLCKGQIKGQKTFFGQNSFQLMYNHKPKSNAPLRKNHKTADLRGGGSTLTVSLTVKYPLFFLTTSLSLVLETSSVIAPEAPIAAMQQLAQLLHYGR